MSAYPAIHRAFRWAVPQRLNMAQLCSRRWAEQPDAHTRVAVVADGPNATPVAHTYAQLQAHANRWSRHLHALGVQRGDRVAIVLPQRFETAVAYMAVMQLGAVAMPLSQLFGPDALSYRIQDSAARVALVDPQTGVGVAAVQADCPTLRHVLDMTQPLPDGPDTFACADTAADDPADWAWTGGLMDALLPTLYFGRPIVAYNGRFSPDAAFDLLERHAISHTFLFPTALKAMMKACPETDGRYRLGLQAIMSAGEAVGDAVFGYGQQQLGVTINEMFGQTEVNYIVGNCARLWPAKPGSMGQGYPGHRVTIVDEHGQPCRAGDTGEVAIHRRDGHGELDPIFFLGYWNKPQAALDKFTGDPESSWFRTGDLARMDDDGYLWYQGRADDVFKAAGYRIGPGEIENCLVKHPAVANAAVVPKPDAERGAVVKAYVVLTPDALATPAEPWVAQLQAHVRGQLAPYEYPKEIEFVTELPMTTTGKVQRRVLRLQEEARFNAQKKS